MFDLVKFECGCTGTRPKISGGIARSFVVDPCDRDRDNDSVYLPDRTRDVTGKEFHPLLPDEINKIHIELVQLVSDGYRFRELVGILKTAILKEKR